MRAVPLACLSSHLAKYQIPAPLVSSGVVGPISSHYAFVLESSLLLTSHRESACAYYTGTVP